MRRLAQLHGRQLDTLTMAAELLYHREIYESWDTRTHRTDRVCCRSVVFRRPLGVFPPREGESKHCARVTYKHKKILIMCCKISTDVCRVACAGPSCFQKTAFCRHLAIEWMCDAITASFNYNIIIFPLIY